MKRFEDNLISMAELAAANLAEKATGRALKNGKELRVKQQPFHLLQAN